jgi:hypothetical protein
VPANVNAGIVIAGETYESKPSTLVVLEMVVPVISV